MEFLAYRCNWLIPTGLSPVGLQSWGQDIDLIPSSSDKYQFTKNQPNQKNC